jgi:hypothetical protein
MQRDFAKRSFFECISEIFKLCRVCNDPKWSIFFYYYCEFASVDNKVPMPKYVKIVCWRCRSIRKNTSIGCMRCMSCCYIGNRIGNTPVLENGVYWYLPYRDTLVYWLLYRREKFRLYFSFTYKPKFSRHGNNNSWKEIIIISAQVDTESERKKAQLLKEKLFLSEIKWAIRNKVDSEQVLFKI